jgi:uncharacterized membrane protein YqjE
MANDSNIVDLLKSIAADAVALVRGHVELAKAELRQSARAAGVALIALMVAIASVNLAVIFAFVSLAYGIADNGYTMSSAFLAVAGILVALAIVVTLVGVLLIRRATRPALSAAQLAATRDTLLGSPRKSS